MKKDKVLIFIIGLLVGAIITASIMLILQKGSRNKFPDRDQFQMMRDGGERPEGMPEGFPGNGEMPEGFPGNGERPEMPSDKNFQKNNKEGRT